MDFYRGKITLKPDHKEKIKRKCENKVKTVFQNYHLQTSTGYNIVIQ